MVEIEGKGLDFERYALNKLFTAFLKRYPITSVLEIPAKGEKAMPSVYSIAFAAAGSRVTLINAEEKSRWAWEELNLGVTYQSCDNVLHTGMALHTPV